MVSGDFSGVEASAVVGDLEAGTALLVDVPPDHHLARRGVALHVGESLLNDTPELLFDPVRQALAGVGGPRRGDAGPFLEPVKVGLGDVGELVLLAHVGAQLVNRLPELLHDIADDIVEVADFFQLVAGQVLDPLELEGHVRERLRDPVVELAGDATALGFGTEGVQAAEPAGVVEREGEDARQRFEEVAIVGPVRLGRQVFDRNGADQRARARGVWCKGRCGTAARTRCRRARRCGR